jgi:phosphopantothenoylcysteine synthetase/decarboxylase
MHSYPQKKHLSTKVTMETLTTMRKEQARDDDDNDYDDYDDDDDDVRIQNMILRVSLFLVTDFEAVGCEGVG